VLRPEHRGAGNAFGAEVSVPLDAPAYERLAGWFGRDPRWSPSPCWRQVRLPAHRAHHQGFPELHRGYGVGKAGL